jgi:glycosyltransferase involved in cell wall biosynthesis
MGLNVFGYFYARIGLSQGARLIVSAIDHSRIPFVCHNLKVGISARQNEKFDKSSLSNNPLFNVNLILVNIGQMDYLYTLYNPKSWINRYNIGYWLWELEELPSAWNRHIDFVDELWVPSKFIYEIFRKKTTKHIEIIPYPIEIEINIKLNRDYFGLPNHSILFLVMFDSLSTIERKNPLSAIKAYLEAFRNDEKVGLVIKVNHPNLNDIAVIQNLIEGRSDVIIIKGEFDIVKTHTLINLCDVFISLHRSEGFGLVIAEAMYLGKIVIATNWSGNVDFMNDENSIPIPYKLVEILDNHNMYTKGNFWANPCIETTIQHLKNIYANQEIYHSLKINAMNDIKKLYSKDVITQKIVNRMTKINKQ